MILLTTKQFADELGVSRQRVEKMIDEGKIDKKKVVYPEHRTTRIWDSELRKLKMKKKIKKQTISTSEYIGKNFGRAIKKLS